MKFFTVKNTSVLLLITENGEMQKIYCGVTKLELAEKKKQSIQLKQLEHKNEVSIIENNQFDGINSEVQPQAFAYNFLEASGPQKTQLQIAHVRQAITEDFLTLPSVQIGLDEFAGSMLQKPSEAADITQLLTEEMERMRKLTKDNEIEQA